MAVIDEIKRFVEEKIKSLTEIEIIVFFYKNPFAMDEPEGIARWLGRRVDVVIPHLESLAKIGVLEKNEHGGILLYYFTRDEKVIRIVKMLVDTFYSNKRAIEELLEKG